MQSLCSHLTDSFLSLCFSFFHTHKLAPMPKNMQQNQEAPSSTAIPKPWVSVDGSFLMHEWRKGAFSGLYHHYSADNLAPQLRWLTSPGDTGRRNSVVHVVNSMRITRLELSDLQHSKELYGGHGGKECLRSHDESGIGQDNPVPSRNAKSEGLGSVHPDMQVNMRLRLQGMSQSGW